MKINPRVSAQIREDIQTAINRQCRSRNMPIIAINSKKELDEQFDKLIKESFIQGLKEPEKSQLMQNEARLKNNVKLSKFDFFFQVQQEVYRTQQIEYTDNNMFINTDNLTNFINDLARVCINEGIDQKIDQRLNEVLGDFFDNKEIPNELLSIILVHKDIAAKNIKEAANPSQYRKNREKVWSTEISRMLENIVFSMKQTKENEKTGFIITKISRKLKKPVALSPAKKWKAWDKETREKLDPLTDDLMAGMSNLQKIAKGLQNDMKQSIKDVKKQENSIKKLKKETDAFVKTIPQTIEEINAYVDARILFDELNDGLDLLRNHDINTTKRGKGRK